MGLKLMKEWMAANYIPCPHHVRVISGGERTQSAATRKGSNETVEFITDARIAMDWRVAAVWARLGNRKWNALTVDGGGYP